MSDEPTEEGKEEGKEETPKGGLNPLAGMGVQDANLLTVPDDYFCIEVEGKLPSKFYSGHLPVILWEIQRLYQLQPEECRPVTVTITSLRVKEEKEED